MAEKRRLGDILVASGKISLYQIQEALKSQKILGKKLGEILVESKLINEIDIIEAIEQQTGIPRIDLNTIDLDKKAINLITENSPALEQKNICPEINLPEFSVFAFSDRNMVARILQNLLTNAIRYTNGNIKINLEQQARNKICFSIENSVSNVSEIDASRLFERFYMADKSRRGGGTGLGLAVVKALVEKLGGSVNANLQSDTLLIILEL